MSGPSKPAPLPYASSERGSAAAPAILRQPLPALALLAALGVTAAAMVVAMSPRFTFGQQLRLSHVALGVIALTMLGLALYFRDWTRGVFTRFFYAVERPTNLAIYRVVLFGTIFFDIDHDASRRVVTFFADLPKGLQVPPPGLGPLLKVLPINSTLAGGALTALSTFSFLAMIGFFTRASAILTVIAALYALGIAQFYGQVNHYHHVIWFASILAASRCGDALSVDAFLAGRKRGGAQDGTIEPPAESRAYSLPLRLIWITIGIVYFWPGFWKYWRSGMDWAFSDNFKHQLHLKWMQRDWVAPFRIDHFPILMWPAAFATLVWEIGFLPAMFFPRVRAMFAGVGAIFHVSTRILMHISFWTLQSSYLSFFNWDWIFRKLGTRFCAEQMVFLYDGNDAKVRARLGAWRTLDVLGRVTYVNVHDSAAAAGVQTTGSAGGAVVMNQLTESVAAWRRLAKRIPLLWPLSPFVGAVGGASQPVAPAATAAPFFQRYSLVGVMTVFGILVAGNTLFGLKEQRTGFPFTCYPPFSRDPGPTASVIEIKPLDAAGNAITWDEPALKKQFGSARYVSLIKHLRLAKDPKQFHAFWEVVKDHNPNVHDAAVVEFYETTKTTDPATWGKNVVGKPELVYTYREGGELKSESGQRSAVTNADGLE